MDKVSVQQKNIIPRGFGTFAQVKTAKKKAQSRLPDDLFSKQKFLFG
jgi:hypothetical protein